MQLAASGTGALATALLSGVGTASQLSVDPGTQTPLGSGLTPQGVAADLSGNLYVADAKANQVVAINIGNNTSTSLITGLNNPNQVAIDGSGNVFVADTANNRIAERPAGGGAIVALGTGFSAPQGVAVDSVGNVYIADTGNNRVVEIVGGPQQIVVPFTGLTKPTRISLDEANDIFVADSGNNRVVEFIAGQGQVAVNLGSTTVKPAGIATDASGNLYVADATGLQVLELLAGTTTVNTVLSSLKAPVDLAAGPNASLYIADSQATGAIALNRALGNITFPITNVSETSNVTFSLANTGNAALSFPGPQVAAPTAPTTIFAVAGAAGNGCSVGSPVAPGANCLLNASFSPTAQGALSQAFSFTTNAANGVATHALLAGTAAHLISTTTAISIISPTTSTIGFGAPVVLSTVVSLASSSGTPTGTVTLSVDGQARPPAAFGTGTIPLTLNLPVGMHIVTAAFSGDSVYASSGSSVSFTVVRASTVTSLTTSSSTPGGTPTISFTAAVSSPTATGETGTVSFYAGTTLLSTSSLAGSSATYTTSNITFSSNSFTAVYSGDVNFATSTSAAVQPVPDFALTSSSSSLATAQGGVAAASVTLTPIFNFSGVVTPSCSNLPSNTVCRFQPTSISFSGNAPVGASIQIYTNVSGSVASLQRRDSSRTTFALVGPLGIGMFALFGCKRGKKVRLVQLLLVAMATLCAASGLSGCLAHQTTSLTPAGAQNVTVSFTSSGSGAPITHSLTYNLTVNTP
jgi:sugar lactone lactonase YvrE